MCYKINMSTLGALSAIAAVLALGSGLRSAAAQGAAGPTSSFSGTLMDAMGRTLPDKPISLTNAATNAAHSTRSDQAGRFAFTDLAAGEYRVDTNVPGFTSRYRVTIGAGQQVERDVPLQVGAIQETIAVWPGQPPSSRGRPSPAALTSACAGSVSGCIDPPMKIRDVKPRFPEGKDAENAAVSLQGRIGTDGFVIDLRLVSPADQAFAAAAIEAVSQWQFMPTRLDGVPVETIMNVAVGFNR